MPLSDFVPYEERKEWADVAPVEQDEGGPAPPAPIAYSPEFASTMNMVRAVVASGERSTRVLALTRDAVRLNPAHYTAWHVRRECLSKAGLLRSQRVDRGAPDPDIAEEDGNNSIMLAELVFVAEKLGESAKNYQLWCVSARSEHG